MIAVAGAAGAEPVTIDDSHIPVRPGAGAIEIPFSTLMANDSKSATIARVTEPVYGSLQEDNGGFIYTPGPAFWSLGIDAFVYSLSDSTGDASATVHLYAVRDDQRIGSERFETASGFTTNRSFIGNTIDVSDLAKAEGDKGLMITAVEGNAYATISRGTGGDDPPEGGGVRLIMTCPPEPPDPFEPSLAIAAVGGLGSVSGISPPSVRLFVVAGNRMRIEVYDSVQGVYYGSQETLPIDGDMVTVELDWFQEGPQIGALLRLDGRAVLTPLVQNPSATFTQLHLGVLQPASSDRAVAIGFDHLEWFAQRAPDDPGISPVHFADDLESGDLSAWAATVGGGLTVIPDSGGHDLYADPAGGAYLADDSPRSRSAAGDEELTVSFRLDVASTSITIGDDKTIYAFGSDPLAMTTGMTDLRARLYGGSGGEPRMFLSFVHNGSPTWTYSAGLEPGVNAVAVQYRVAEEADATTGYVRLWLNGAEAGEHRDLTNHAQAVAWSHLGAYGAGAPGLAGALYLDDYVSAGRLPLGFTP